jgi:hypothetical protein
MNRPLPLLPALLALLIPLGAARALDLPAGTRMRLVEGAAYTNVTQLITFPPVERVTASVLLGSMRFDRVPSPLDWDSYQVSAVDFLAVDNAGKPFHLLGEGSYRVGGRGVPQQQMELTLTNGSEVLLLKTDPVPVDAAAPTIDILLTFKASKPGADQTYAVRIVAAPELQRWHYQLVGGSTLLDDCAVCDRLSLPVPITGDFDLVQLPGDPLHQRYRLVNLNVSDAAFMPENFARLLWGEAAIEIGGEVALRQNWVLHAGWTQNQTNVFRTFTNNTPAVERDWPMLRASLTETEGTMFSTFSLVLNAAPTADLWFMTARGFTPSKGPPSPTVPPTQTHVPAGTILHLSGARTVPTQPLLAPLQIDQPETITGLDAFDVAPGAEVWFSLPAGAKSKVVGEILEGDLLSAAGYRVKSNQQLLSPFGLMPGYTDVGLDAVHRTASGEILFSIRQDEYSERLGLTLHHGDVLSDSGRVVASHQALLARFHLENPDQDYGLDALYLWESGEIWFSVETSFNDQELGRVGDGDLLSSGGYIVYLNRELMAPFGPLEDLADFGLQSALPLATTPVLAKPPTLAIRLTGLPPATAVLEAAGLGRAFRLRSASTPAAPFQPLGLPGLEHAWTIPLANSETPAAFHQVEAW